MAVDITDQDIFVLGGVEYPIRKVELWPWRAGLVSAIARRANQTASTKRLPAIAGGKIGAAAANLTGVKCTPLYPVDAEVLARIGLQTPYNIFETFVDGNPILHLYVEQVRVT